MQGRNWLLWICLLACVSCQGQFEQEKRPFVYLNGILLERIEFPVKDKGTIHPTCIVMHSSRGKDLHQTLEALKELNAKVHIIIDQDAKIYLLSENLEKKNRALTALDEYALHIMLIGDELYLLEPAKFVVNALCDVFSIPKTNFDVESYRGVFSHSQVKYRFGGLQRYESIKDVEPSDEFMQLLLEGIDGEYFPEDKWKNRDSIKWCYRKPSPTKVSFDKGRGISPTPKAELKSVEQDENGYVIEDRRIRYTDRGKIQQVKGVVLHFTGTQTYEAAVREFEFSDLRATIIVDTDGRAYQVLDDVEDKPAAAAGTNHACIQIEIVGRSEKELLSNKQQFEKVVEVVKELCERYDIARNNFDVASLSGVFSHGQVKKYFGGSRSIFPKEHGDFDPGEKYMQEVLEAIGGRYFQEEEWKGRKSDRWAILFYEWIP